jgi:transposase
MNRNDARLLSEETIYELRCRAVDLKREGCTYEEVSVVLKVSISAVRKWWDLYQNGGPKALRLGQRGRRQGQCRRLSPQQERMVCRMITDKRPDQLKMPFALWTRQAVQELIERQFALKMPIRTVGEYLRRWGFTPQKPRRQRL